MKLKLKEFTVREVEEQQTIRREKQPHFLSVFPEVEKDRK